MKEKESLLDQQILDCLNTAYGLKITQLREIPLGADIDASVYRAQAQDKSSYFIKLKRGKSHNIETTLQQLLHNAGIQEIIPPLGTMHGSPLFKANDFTLTAYPFIEGKNGFSQNLTDMQWVTLGNALKRVHGFNVPASIKKRIKHEDYSSKWRNAARSIYTQIDTKQIKAADEIALKLITVMTEQRETIERLIHCAEHLAQKLQHQSIEFVLCHADIHGGNVLLAQNGKLYIVDWDQPIMAPKERDLMFIGGGIANVWNKPYEEELFYTGYGNRKVNREALAYYRCERIVEDIVEYCQQLLLTPCKGDRAILYQQCIDMFEPGGVVAIASKTHTNL